MRCGTYAGVAELGGGVEDGKQVTVHCGCLNEEPGLGEVGWAFGPGDPAAEPAQEVLGGQRRIEVGAQAVDGRHHWCQHLVQRPP